MAGLPPPVQRSSLPLYRLVPTGQATPCSPHSPAAPARPASNCARWPRLPSGLRRWCRPQPQRLKKVTLEDQAVLEAIFTTVGDTQKSTGRERRVFVALQAECRQINPLDTNCTCSPTGATTALINARSLFCSSLREHNLRTDICS